MAKESKRVGISVNIPGRPVGRLIDALTDMIRPFSEARGLKADQIRVQRAEVAIEIARRARTMLDAENAKIKPVPNKILVLLLEAASNESLDDNGMIDMWASLLASAATGDQVHPRFISILKELQGRQAQLLYQVAKHAWASWEYPETELINASTDLQATFVRRFILPEAIKAASTKHGCDYGLFRASIFEATERPGCALIDAAMFSDDEMHCLSTTERPFNDLYQNLDFEILTSLGLCESVHEYSATRKNIEFSVQFYFITRLGLTLLAQCLPEFAGIKKELDDYSEPPKDTPVG